MWGEDPLAQGCSLLGQPRSNPGVGASRAPWVAELAGQGSLESCAGVVGAVPNSWEKGGVQLCPVRVGPNLLTCPTWAFQPSRPVS